MGTIAPSSLFTLYVPVFLLSSVQCAIANSSDPEVNQTYHEKMVVTENFNTSFGYNLEENLEGKFLIDVKIGEAGTIKTVCRCTWPIGRPKCHIKRKDSYCDADTSEMRMSLLIKRTYTEVIWEIFKHGNSPVVRKRTELQVMYPPQITQLCINGEDVNETYIIEENQDVNVSCFFNNGNPPVSIRLLNDTLYTESSTTHGEGTLTMSLGRFYCHDVWPTIRCEAPGSELNRSVTILIRCPPRVTFMPSQVVEMTSVAEGMTIGLKSYTNNITKCMMTKLSPKSTSKKVMCEVSGNIPEFNLTLQFARESWIENGNWMLHITTQLGDTNTTFQLIKSATQTDILRRPGNDPRSTRFTVLMICGCLLSITTSSVLLFCAVRRARQCEWGKHCSQFLTPESANRDNTDNHQDDALYEAGDVEAIGHAVASCSSRREVQEPSSGHRRADGLIYRELDFSEREPSNVIIGSLPNTQYAQINFSAAVRLYQK